MKRFLFEFAFVILITLPVILPVFKPYVPGVADGFGHKFRLVSFYKSLKEGNLRPRWADESALGYGAPVFLYNYPLPYYLGSLFLFLGSTVNGASQLISASSFLLSAVFMFFLLRKKTGSFIASLAGSSAYLYAPYHLQMSYLYGAWGEELAFVFPPLILLLLILICEKKDVKVSDSKTIIIWVLFTLAHNLSAVMISPIILILTVFRHPLPFRKILRLIYIFVWTVILSAFFWLPGMMMVKEIKYPELLVNEGIMRGSFFKSISFMVQTSFDVVKRGQTVYLDHTVGFPMLMAAIIGIIILIDKIHKREKNYLFLLVLLILFVVTLFLVTPYSRRIWELPLVLWIPPSYILYPFRFLIAVSFIGAILTGVISKKSRILGLFFIIVAVIQGLPYTKPNIEIFPFPDNYFWQRQTVFSAPTTRKNMIIVEHLPKNADTNFLKVEEEKYYKDYFQGAVKERTEAFVSYGEAKITNVVRRAEKSEMQVEAKNEADITINRFYFPNWKVSVDEVQEKINMDSVGRILVKVQKGMHTLKLTFGVTQIEQIAGLISLTGIIFLFLKRFLWK